MSNVSAYDFVRYGGLEGRVVSIAADADTDRSGQHYFRVVVETTDSTLGADGTLPIIPGMQATIDIHTGEKRVLDYLIQRGPDLEAILKIVGLCKLAIRRKI